MLLLNWKTNFSIKIYEVGDITEDQLALLMKQYPIIHKMYKTNSYVDLLKSPFYINLVMLVIRWILII